MEQARKNLKITSIVILICAAFSFLTLIIELFFADFGDIELPEGSPENIVLITQIFVLIISAILLLPRLYMGIKGLRIAKNPNSSKAHIVWATIFFVLAILGLFSPIAGLVQWTDVAENITTLIRLLVEIVILFGYIKYAKVISKAVK